MLDRVSVEAAPEPRPLQKGHSHMGCDPQNQSDLSALTARFKKAF